MPLRARAAHHCRRAHMRVECGGCLPLTPTTAMPDAMPLMLLRAVTIRHAKRRHLIFDAAASAAFHL